MLISKTTRRVFLTGLSTFAGLAMLPSAGFSMTKANAKNLINSLSNDIFKVINSGKSKSAMYNDFNRILGKYAAIEAIAKTTLGPPWRSATPAQQKAYITAFRGYLSRKYGKRFREFIGAKINVVSTKPVKSGYLVKSIVKLQGSSPFELEWQVFERKGKIQMFDLYIVGISLIKTEREEIGAMLDRNGGNIDKLTATLNISG